MPRAFARGAGLWNTTDFFYTPMAKTRQDKEQALTDLKEKMGRMESLIFTRYQGLSVKDVTDLRRSLRIASADGLAQVSTLNINFGYFSRSVRAESPLECAWTTDWRSTCASPT